MQLSARVPSVGYPTVAGCGEPAVPSVAFHPLVLGLVLTSLAACGGATKAIARVRADAVHLATARSREELSSWTA